MTGSRPDEPVVVHEVQRTCRRRANGTVGFWARRREHSRDVTGPKAACRPASPDGNCETHARRCRILAARRTVSAFLD